MASKLPLGTCISIANTGLDAIKRAPIVEHDTGVKCLRIQDVSQSKEFKNWGFTEVTPVNFEKFQLKKGDILIARTGGSIGVNRYIFEDLPAVYNNGLIRIRVDTKRYYPKFVYYLLRTDSFKQHINAIAFSTAAQPNMKIRDFLRFEYLDLELDKQIYIASILSDLDSKIELNRQTNQTLENIAQAIFKSWFVDFEPTRAKIVAKQNGQDPEHAAMAAISGKTITDLDHLTPEQQSLKSTAALFPDTLTDSELGQIPNGWKCSEIGDEVTVAGGGTPSTKKEEFWDGGHINWTSPKDMSNLTDKILLETNKKITKAGLAKISSGLLPKNTVLMSSRAPVGYLAISKIPVAINQGYIAMKCEGTLTPEYVVQWTESVMGDIKQRASGTTFAEISKKNFKIIPVIVPEVELLSEFSEIVSDLYEKITEGVRETGSLTEIRDALLPKLLSGEMRLEG